MSSGPTSPTLSSSSSSSASSTTTSRFKSIKKKIKSTFKGKQRGSLVEVDQVLKRSSEFEDALKAEETSVETSTSSSVLQFQTEFKALKEALENMMNESKTLQLAIKTVDANCPDPFEQPESFSLYLAKKADSSFLLEEQDEAALVEGGLELKSELERLKAVKLVEESLHQAEREALAAAMAQLEVLKGELEQVNKQNTAFMTQIQQLKQIQSANEELDQLKAENTQLSAQLSAAQSDLKQLQENYQQTTLSESQTSEESKSIAAELEAKLAELTVSNSQLQSQLTAANSEMESKLVEFMASKFEIEEVNARLSLELKEAQDQLREYEKETVKEKADSLAEPVAEEIDFKYNYLSNVIINYLQRPEQRPQLIGVLATTLQLSPEDINKLKL